MKFPFRRSMNPPRDKLETCSWRRCLAAGVVACWTSCSTPIPPSAVAWNDHAAVLAPTTSAWSTRSAVGYLRVETDTDLREIGRQTYYNVRRPYDLYAADGHLLRADIDNQDGHSGEEPVLRPLAPGRYVVASMVGTTYRKVQVEIRAGARTDVPEDALRQAPAVFAH
jgi:hypothetical protein